MTPAELVSAQRAALERRRREAEESNMQIYVLANLTANFVWSKGQRPSYDAIFHPEKVHEMDDDKDFYKTALGITRSIPSEETLRQRMDDIGDSLRQ